MQKLIIILIVCVGTLCTIILGLYLEAVREQNATDQQWHDTLNSLKQTNEDDNLGFLKK